MEIVTGFANFIWPGFLLALPPAHTGRVVYLAVEDPPPAPVRRIKLKPSQAVVVPRAIRHD